MDTNYGMKGHVQNTSQIKKLSSATSSKGHTSPGKNVAGKISFSEYEMPINFQASVTTFQDNFFKIL